MAEVTLEQAIELAIRHQDDGQLAEAESIYRQILRQFPQQPVVVNNLAALLRRTGRLDEGIVLAKQAIALLPNVALPYSNLGVMLHLRNDLAAALPVLKHAVDLQPDSAETQFDYANVLLSVGRFAESIKGYRQAVALNPRYAEAFSNLGTLLHMMGRLDEAIASDRRALELKPNYYEAHSRMLYTLNFQTRYDPAEVFGEHVRFDEQHAAPLRSKIRPHENDRSPDRRLRIGYVTSDFVQHAVTFFLEPILTNHDHERFEIFCYSNAGRHDAVSTRLKSHADHWREIHGISNEQAAEMIRADKIDILVELAGHTESTRIMIFAHKPAPIQATYLGYPNTTGVKTIDYRITDAIADPPGLGDEFYVERLVRLARSSWCYRPFEDAPPVGEVPALAAGHVTFGSFNNAMKINDELIAIWTRLLKAVPNAKIIVKAVDLREPELRQRMLDRFAAAGADPARVQALGPLAMLGEHLEVYNRVDIALDSFPYNGTTTTCEALWMGVPVVTLAGDRHAARVGASLLAAIGLPDLIGKTSDEYIAIASKLAGDLPRLADLRRTLRQRFAESPLMRGRELAGAIEEFYRDAWRKWCA